MNKKFTIAKLITEARDYIISKGAVLTNDNKHYHLNTLAGSLRLWFVHDGDLASIFGRFENPQAAIAILGQNLVNPHSVNPHSGKWNWHWTEENEPQLLGFKREIDLLTKPLEVIVTVEGGVIQHVDVPPGVSVIVKDYDVDGSEENLATNDDGDKFVQSVWFPADEENK